MFKDEVHGVGVWGLGFGVQGSGSGFRVKSLELRV